jgi:hypothetical protein
VTTTPEVSAAVFIGEPQLELVRLAVVPDGAFGILKVDGLPWLATLERTYPISGVLQLVKIPAGTWTCKRTEFNRGGYDTFEVTGVPGHSRLLFHIGNSETDSEGCILLGRRFGALQGHWSVFDSRLAFYEFMGRFTAKDEFTLRVRHDEGVDARWSA